MDYGIAIAAGRLALFLAVLAPGYYLLRTAYVRLQRRGLSPEAAQRLRQAVTNARLSHPYIGGLLAVAPLYHIFAMWLFHPLSLKTALGMAAAAAVAFMAASGWRLKGDPAGMKVRQAHRYGFFVFAALLAAHRLV